MFLSGGMSAISSVAEVVGMLTAFTVVLAAAYFATRYLGKYAAGGRNGGNIHILETVKLAPERYLQIIEISERYFLIGVSKTDISLITELKKEEVKDYRSEIKTDIRIPFKDLLDRARKNKEKD